MRAIFATALAAALLSGISGYGTGWAQTPQQQLMKSCNAQAGSQKLTGAARKSFMSKCLSSKPAAATLTPQQQKMQTCNTQASAQKLSGDARQKFMSTCLKG